MNYLPSGGGNRPASPKYQILDSAMFPAFVQQFLGRIDTVAVLA